MGFSEIPVQAGTHIKASQILELQNAVMERIQHVSPSTPSDPNWSATLRRYIALPAGGESTARPEIGKHLALTNDSLNADPLNGLRMCVCNLFGIGISGNWLDLFDVVQYGLPTTGDRASPEPWEMGQDPAGWPSYFYHNPDVPYTSSNNQWLMEYIYDTRTRKSWIRKPERAQGLVQSDYIFSQDGNPSLPHTYVEHLNEIQGVVKKMKWMMVAHNYDLPERLWGGTGGPRRGFHGDRWESYVFRRQGPPGQFPPLGTPANSGESGLTGQEAVGADNPKPPMQETFTSYRIDFVGSTELPAGVSTGSKAIISLFSKKLLRNNMIPAAAGKTTAFSYLFRNLQDKAAAYAGMKKFYEDGLPEYSLGITQLWVLSGDPANTQITTHSSTDLPDMYTTDPGRGYYDVNLDVPESAINVFGSFSDGVLCFTLLSADEIQNTPPVNPVGTEGAGQILRIFGPTKILVMTEITSFSYT